MKFSGRDRRRAKAPALALTSMLDVIFLLLCFFVTASVFSQWESEISISLPAASSSETPSRLPGEVIHAAEIVAERAAEGRLVRLPLR